MLRSQIQHGWGAYLAQGARTDQCCGHIDRTGQQYSLLGTNLCTLGHTARPPGLAFQTLPLPFHPISAPGGCWGRQGAARSPFALWFPLGLRSGAQRRRREGGKGAGSGCWFIPPASSRFQPRPVCLQSLRSEPWGT